jgi:hypothetical protein
MTPAHLRPRARPPVAPHASDVRVPARVGAPPRRPRRRTPHPAAPHRIIASAVTTSSSASPRAAMKRAPQRGRSCCAFFCALVLEVLAWGLAVVAITTSFWLGARAARCAVQRQRSEATHARAPRQRQVPAVAPAACTRRRRRGGHAWPLALAPHLSRFRVRAPKTFARAWCTHACACAHARTHARACAAPTSEALPGVSHAGLWLSCSDDAARSSGALLPPPPPPPPPSELATTIQQSIRSVQSDVSSVLRGNTGAAGTCARRRSLTPAESSNAPLLHTRRAEDGCGNASDAFRNLNGGDYRLMLTIVRALVLGFLALGLAKARWHCQRARLSVCVRAAVRWC